jgi:hypothetical protein
MLNAVSRKRQRKYTIDNAVSTRCVENDSVTQSPLSAREQDRGNLKDMRRFRRALRLAKRAISSEGAFQTRTTRTAAVTFVSLAAAPARDASSA